MTKRKAFSSTVAAVLGFAGQAPATAADTVESAEKHLLAQWAKVRSVSATMAVDSEMNSGGIFYTVRSSGTYECLKTDGKVLSRTEVKSVSVTKRGEREMKSESTITTIYDGEYLYTMREHRGRKTATKTKPNSPPGLDVRSALDARRRDNTLKLLPDQKFGGQAVYVIEATAKDPTASTAQKLMYFAKDSGIMVKSVSHDEQQRIASTTMYQDVKVNQEIPADRFVFRAPPDVAVRDMTSQQP